MYQIMKTKQIPMTTPMMMESLLFLRFILLTRLLIIGNLLERSFSLVWTAWKHHYWLKLHYIYISVNHLQYFSLVDEIISGVQCDVDLLVNEPLRVAGALRLPQQMVHPTAGPFDV